MDASLRFFPTPCVVPSRVRRILLCCPFVAVIYFFSFSFLTFVVVGMGWGVVFMTFFFFPLTRLFPQDFNYLSKWVAVPLVSDTRVLAYNKTTFSSLGIDPPPGPGEVGWEWSDFVDAARRIYEGTGRPGWYFRGRCAVIYSLGERGGFLYRRCCRIQLQAPRFGFPAW